MLSQSGGILAWISVTGTKRTRCARSKVLEGQTIALDWEAPEAFATRDTWVADAVAHAERLLRTSR
jgi:hypothetical protein